MRAFFGPWRCLILLLSLFYLSRGELANVQKCGDAQCNGPISTGRTLLKYHANSNSLLSFGPNLPVQIFSKGEGTQNDIWGVEINGKRGFVNRRHVQESRVLVRDLQYVAPPHANFYETQLGDVPVPTTPPVESSSQPPVVVVEPQPEAPKVVQPDDASTTEAPKVVQPDDASTTEAPKEPEQENEKESGNAEEEPVPEGQVHQEQVHQEQVHQEQVHQEQVHQEQVFQEQVLQEQVLQEQVHQEQVHQEQVHQEQVHDQQEHELGEEIKEPEPVESEPVEPGPVEPEPAEPEPVETDNNEKSTEEAGTQTQKEEPGMFEETVMHYVEMTRHFVPDWLHKSFHWNSVDGVSPLMVVILVVVAFTLVFLNLIYLIMDKLSREKPLIALLAQKDKEIFKLQNDYKILLRNSEEAAKKNGSVIQAANNISNSQPPPMIKREVPIEVLHQLEALKHEKEQFISEQYQYQEQIQNYVQELQRLQSVVEQTRQELNEAEAVVQECLDEKKRLSKHVDNTELIRAIDTLREQLNSQKEAVHKYEGKIRRREAELKEKTQELRKLRADTANAKLQVDKITTEKELVSQKISGLEAENRDLADEMSGLQVKVSVQESLKRDLSGLKEQMDLKEEELEAKCTEVEVLKATVEGLKASFGNNNTDQNSDKGDGNNGGWDVEDEVSFPATDFDAIEEMAKLKVDVQKAQSACQQLSEQLVSAETSRDQLEMDLKESQDQLEVARKAKENALQEKTELGTKHEVLTSYFNQREAELQKQLGLQTQRLGDATNDSQSVGKKINNLYDELESYKAQCKSLRQEMEEQERSLKSQNAVLEKKQHESWVTVRQETRRLAELQTEMQTLRNRLTLAESKLAEKEVELRQLKEENATLKDSMDRIVKPEAIFANGNGDLPLLGSSRSSGAGSLKEEPPPDLPMLPPLPMMPPMMGMAAPMLYPADSRPAPLGRRSPPHHRYSRSPSPPPVQSQTRDRYPSSNGDRRYRDVSPARSDRSRTRYDSYASSDYGHYSPAPPRDYHRRSSRDSQESDREYSRDKRRDRVKDNRQGPKTSSPMDPYS